MTNLESFELLSSVPEIQRAELAEKLRGRPYTPKQKLIRKVANAVSGGQTSNQGIRHLFTLAKKMRALTRSAHQGMAELLDVPWKLNADVVLTHDVDWDICWDSLPDLIAWEEEAGVRSVILPLTKGPYKLESQYLDECEQRGFEIGLHGETHDPSLSFKRKSKIADILRRCIDALGRMPVLFRSPALSYSDKLFNALAESGIPRDSSIPVDSPYIGGCGFPGPYEYPGVSGIVEYPLSMQDDMIFRDRILDDDEAYRYVIGQVNRTMDHAGLFVFNTHPGITIKHERFYRTFLERCIKEGIRIRKISEVTSSA